MSKGRKPLNAVAITGDVYDADALAQRHQQLAAMNEHQQALVDEFGDGLPWHPDHYEAAIRGELRRGCEAFLRAGRYLLVARECAVHGEWTSLLTRLGISQAQAHRMTEAARRVSALPNHSRANDLIAATGTQSKLIELLSLPEDQFAELAEHGATGDLDLDDVEQMTRDELRAAVREARADAQAKDERIGELSDEVNRAKEKAAKVARAWKKSTPDEQLDRLLEEARKAAASVRLAIAAGSEEAGLCGAVVAVMEHAAVNRLNVDAEVAGILSDLINDLRLVRDHGAVPISLIQDKRLVDWQQDVEG